LMLRGACCGSIFVEFCGGPVECIIVVCSS
jgi:hypothetical protein